MLKVHPTQYIYPPRPADAIPRDQTDILGELGWLAQFKYNDSRCLVKYLPNGTIELWNRHGERFRNYTAPDWLLDELHQAREMLELPLGFHLFDGGLLDSKHKAIKDTIVIWDILVRNGEHLLDTTYADRYASLALDGMKPWVFSHEQYSAPVKFGLSYTSRIFLPENHTHDKWPELWQLVEKVNAPWNDTAGPLLEGLVFKDPQGRLGMGYREKNNSGWLMRSRVKTGRHDF